MKRYTVRTSTSTPPGSKTPRELHEVIDTQTGKCLFDTSFYLQALKKCEQYNLNELATWAQAGRKA